MENGLLDAAPVFTDVTTFPWRDYAPFMAGGILSFGWPCQPVSTAGKRKATEDERWLFDIIADGISILCPGMLFAENVEGLLSAKMPDGSSVFGHCIERLESLHYKVAAGIFSASEVGAVHQRKRVFIMAHNSSTGLEGATRTSIQGIGERFAEYAGEMADTNSRRMLGSRNELGDFCEVGQGWENTSQNGIIGNVWPSRPGQPQYAWEPPRVVENSKLVGRRGRGDGNEGGLHGEIQTAGSCGSGGEEAVGNATSKRSCGGSEDGTNQQPEMLGTGHEAMGNSECIRIPTSREHGAMDEASGIPTDRERSESPQADTESSSAREREGSGINVSECSEIKPEVGRNIDGTTYGMDISKLSSLSNSELAEILEWMVKGDNRTDELRSCGNGVCPPTATKAFITLYNELLKNE